MLNLNRIENEKEIDVIMDVGNRLREREKGKTH